MNTIELIINEMNYFKQTSADGVQPDFVYLGHNEHRVIADLARQFAFIDVCEPIITEESRRLEWCGMKVFLVNAKSFIGFGYRPPSPAG